MMAALSPQVPARAGGARPARAAVDFVSICYNSKTLRNNNYLSGIKKTER
jgi:hypothetical protein